MQHFLKPIPAVARIQPKLRVNEPGDKYEQEADAMAEKVMRMTNRDAPKLSGTTTSVIGKSIQRKCAKCEEEEKRKLMRKESPGGFASTSVMPSVSSMILSSVGKGQAMDTPRKTLMERAFNKDFSNVRVHTGGAAAEMSDAIQARAFTFGHDIFFNREQYSNSREGKRLLAHELTHVLQQDQTKQLVQRDWALTPPHLNAAPRVLNQAEINSAIAYNNRFLANIPNSNDIISLIRDVLGISELPAIVDNDFVNAVVNWQAVNGFTQDGQLGPTSAHRLFQEIGAEGQGKCEIDQGPGYNPHGVINVPAGAGLRNAFFRFAARFKSDPANKILPSCCEVRQLIRWNAAAVAAFAPATVPHGGFPAGTAADTWIEDRDNANQRYGHRSGAFSDPQTFDQYIDSGGHRNQPFGHIYRGNDSPGGTGLTGQWRFLIRVLDICNNNNVVGGQDTVNVNW